MKRGKSKGKAPKIRLVGAQAPVGAAVTAVASLAAATATAAPGDLDPAFGDVGRWVSSSPLGYYGSELRAAEALDDDDVLFGGGGEYCYFSCYLSYYLGRLDGDGSPDPAFGPPVLPNNTEIHGIAPQPDGKVVSVARQESGGSKFLVIRTLANGALDPDFGLQGIATVTGPGGAGGEGRAVVIDADGRILVVGVNGSKLLVSRLLSNGATDPEFATNGVLELDLVSLAYRMPIRILRTDAGAYRVMVTTGSADPACAVVAITAAGALDTTYGSGGIARPSAGDAGPYACVDAARQSGDRIVLSGNTSQPAAAVVRLLPSGLQDSTFDSYAALGSYQGAAAVAVDASGRLLVAPSGNANDAELRVMRLTSNGGLDASYGREGVAIIDLPGTILDFARIRAVRALSGDRALVAGDLVSQTQPFVARLLGSAPGGSPGVLGLRRPVAIGTEQQGQAVVLVRRTGGSSGAVSVNYTTAPQTDGSLAATADVDYTSTSGRLDWADGDESDRQIVVPLLNDSLAEAPEFFRVTLSSAGGGAGIGLTTTNVEIAGAGYPAGQFEIRTSQPSVLEGLGALFVISRQYYSEGAVSVTVRVAAESTATPGSDFTSPGSSTAWQDQVVTWADGEMGDKVLSVSVLRDKRSDSGETIVLELVSPTGGAVLGAATKATMATVNNAGSSTGSGGGAFGLLGAMLLGLAGLARRWPLRRQHGGAAKA